ncbi:MAG: NEW3 domain-containing protein [Candidatus Aenigmatarchaeota archaeon]
MKKIIFLIFIPLLLVPNLTLALTCTISTSCNAVTLFKISSLTNAHAELPGQTNYGYYVCCNENGLGNSCSGTYTIVLKLSSQTNAHVEEKTYINYVNSVCLSLSSGSIDCQYADDNCNNLGSDYVCVASISSRTNAHVGDCNAYSRKICCKAVVSGPPTCVRSNPTVSIIPQSQSTSVAGTTLTYTVSIINNDNLACGSSIFSLSVNCPSGWICNLAQTSLTVSPGGNSNSTTINVTSPLTASQGTYSFTVRATNNNDPSYYGQGTGNYTITPSVNCVGNLSLSISGSGTCTVNARVTASNCDGKSFDVKDESGNIKCSGVISGNNFLYDCAPWDVVSNGGITYTYKLFVDNVENDSAQVTCNPSVLVCSGDIQLTLDKTVVPPSASVTPSASGLSNCDGKKISFRDNACGLGNEVSSCIVSGNGCQGSSFTAPSSDGFYRYYACIDKNENGNFNDQGESDDETLQVDSSLQADFIAWLGMEEVNVITQQNFPVSVYVKNTGSLKDNYEFKVQTSSSNVQARVYDKEISNVFPGSVISTKVEIKVLALSSQEEVKVNVTSKSSRESKELTITLKIGSSSMSDLDVLSVLLIIGLSVIFLIKRMH